MVDQYPATYAKNACTEHEVFAGLPTLARAVAHAARARTVDDRRHPHQRRIPEAVLARSERVLQTAHRELRSARSFDDLFQLADRAIGSIRAIGDLTVYDTSARIGSFFGVRPAAVYLHAGERAGARFLGLNTSRKSIPLSELPAPLRKLTGEAAEDILCIFKDSSAFLGHSRVAS